MKKILHFKITKEQSIKILRHIVKQFKNKVQEIKQTLHN